MLKGLLLNAHVYPSDFKEHKAKYIIGGYLTNTYHDFRLIVLKLVLKLLSKGNATTVSDC